MEDISKTSQKCTDCSCDNKSAKHSHDAEDPSLESCPADTENQGKAKMCEGCPGQSMCKQLSNSEQFREENEKLKVRMNAIKHKIIVVSNKGGVGKSSIASSLALRLSELKYKVGILDVDICGPSIARLLNVEDQKIVNTDYGWIPVKSKYHDICVMSVAFMIEGTQAPVIWRGPRKTNLIKRFLKDTYWGKLDFLIIDTPPGTSDEHLSIFNSLKSADPDGAVIVTTPQDVALSTIKKQINFCQKMKFPILGIIENMSGFICPCCNEQYQIFSSDTIQAFASQFNLQFLGKIPLDPKVVECLDAGKCIFCEHKGTPAIDALSSTVQTLLSKLTVQ